MNDIEFEQELNNLISKSIYKKLKIYNCKCTRCSSLFIANLDNIQCNICKNKNLNKIDIAYLDNEEYLDFAESIYTNEFIYKIHNKKEENEILKREDFRKKQENLDKIDLVENIEQNEEVPVVKNKSAIEKELFEEFNEKTIERNKEEKQENKLPEIDIDQYMKNFNENDVDDVDNIFNDDNIFPSIPL